MEATPRQPNGQIGVPRCQRCSYDLRDIDPTRCPECGQANPLQGMPRLPWWIGLPLRCWVWASGVVLIAKIGVHFVVPRFVWVGGFPNGASPSAWWWVFNAQLSELCGIAAVLGFPFLILAPDRVGDIRTIALVVLWGMLAMTAYVL